MHDYSCAIAKKLNPLFLELPLGEGSTLQRMLMFYLQRNLPWWARLLRLALGATVAMAALALEISGATLWLTVAVAATLALTGFVGVCPACALFGRRPLRKVP